jgi:diguanylate cyclase (GGDEF)-like protein
MKKEEPTPGLDRLNRIKLRVYALCLLFFIVFQAYLYFIQGSSIAMTGPYLAVGLVAAFIIVTVGFREVFKLQSKLDEQLLKTQQQTRRQDALIQLSTELSASLNETDICQKVVEGLSETLGYEHIGVLIVDPKTGSRRAVASYGWPKVPQNWEIPSGKGISERALLDGELHYTPDVKIEPDYIPGLGSGAEIDVPIRFGEEIIGVLVVESTDPNDFDTEDFAVLTVIANQFAIAIKNARRFHTEQAKYLETEILRQATATLTSDLGLDHVLDHLLIQLEKVIPYDSACIFLLEGELLRAKAQRGLPEPDKVLGYYFPIDNELIKTVFETGQPLTLADVQTDERFQGWGGTYEMHGWMGVPFKARGQVIGYLTLDSREIAAYNEHSTEQAQVFANQAAIAIENTRLYQSAIEAAERRAVLHRVSQEMITASANPEQIYTAIHRAVAELMPSEAFIIGLLDASQGDIEIIYLIDRGQRYQPHRSPTDRGLSGYVINTGEPLLINEFTPEKATELNVAHFGTEEHIRSILAVPLRLGKYVFGILSAQCYLPNVYTEEDQRLLEMLAAHAAIALDNARLFSKVQNLAITDSLTGVYNRRQLLDIAQYEFNRAKRYSRPLSAIMLDLDGFKQINDTHGHATGDRVLRAVAQRFQKNIRKIDTLGRYGGDEFAIVMPETKHERALSVGYRLRDCMVETPIIVDEQEYQLTISVGVATISPQTQDLFNLLVMADNALYAAKAEGKNRVSGITNTSPTS